MLLSSHKHDLDDPRFVYELKHDGFRTLAVNLYGKPKLISRRGNDLSATYPEVVRDLAKLPACILDGELVVLDEQGRSNFDRLRRRLAMTSISSIQRACTEFPSALFAFDLLWLEGRDMRKLPLLKRKERLKRLLHGMGRVCYLHHIGEGGKRLFDAAGQLGLEGIVAKKADSAYRKGKSYDWVKIKTAAGLDLDEMRAKWNA